MAKGDTTEQDEAVYAPPASQVQLEQFYEHDEKVMEAADSGEELDLPQPYRPPTADAGLRDLQARDFGDLGGDRENYIGTDTIYQGRALETDQPLVPEEGPEAETVRRVRELEGFGQVDPGKDAEGDVDEGAPKRSATKKSSPPPPPGETDTSKS